MCKEAEDTETHDSEIALPNVWPRETYEHAQEAGSKIFTAATFIIAPNWAQPRHPFIMIEWIN